jgi:hypothetical protein
MLALSRLSTRQEKTRLAAVSTALLVAGVFVWFWNEARNEVFFLCSNFRPGVTEASVITQLDTGSFLSYAVANAAEGSGVIIVSSPLSLISGECIVDLDSRRLVREAVYR